MENTLFEKCIGTRLFLSLKMVKHSRGSENTDTQLAFMLTIMPTVPLIIFFVFVFVLTRSFDSSSIPKGSRTLNRKKWMIYSKCQLTNPTCYIIRLI